MVPRSLAAMVGRLVLPFMLGCWLLSIDAFAFQAMTIHPKLLLRPSFPESTCVHDVTARYYLHRIRLSAPVSRMSTETPQGSEASPKIRIVAAVVEKDGKVLMVERTKRSRGFWEFPGGKVEDGETDQVALLRELKEELGENVTGTIGELCAVGHDGPVQLISYHVDIQGEISNDNTLNVRWVEVKDELCRLAVPPADAATIKTLLNKNLKG